MEKIVFYGAGVNGKNNYLFLKTQGLSKIVNAFCDKNADEIQKVDEIEVISFEDAQKMNLPFVITVDEKTNGYKEIIEILEKSDVVYYANLREYAIKRLNYDQVKWNREYCAYTHISNMDDYFDDAESKEKLNIFWAEDSLFFNMFQKLNLEKVVELACGRGRHVPQYISKAKEIVLVDILDKNIEFVRRRFSDCENIHFYKNNGYNFEELPDSSYTAIFSYDAVVHFEMWDIYNYLQDMYRILVPGGMALIHHSNDSSDYRNSFQKCTNPGGRSFMDKKIFAYLAYRCGFEIVEQHVIDWSAPEMDCVSLIRKA